MVLYHADRNVLRRSLEIYRTLRAEIEPPDCPAAGSRSGQAIRALGSLLDAELGMWSDDSTADAGLLPTATTELAATWVCLEMVRFMAAAAVLEAAVAESWSDKLDAWREHGRETALTIGRTSGDWDAARAYLHHCTEELLGRPSGES